MPQKHEVKNWGEYNGFLKQRGNLFLYFDDDFSGERWKYRGERKPGGRIKYDDGIIKACYGVKFLFKLPLRQTQGLCESLLKKVWPDMEVPNYTTMSRRLAKMEIEVKDYRRDKGDKENLDIVIDSTGISIYNNTGSHGSKASDVRKHRGFDQYRKVSLCMDLKSGRIIRARYDEPRVSDDAAGVRILRDLKERPRSLRADGAYDSKRIYEECYRLGTETIIPPCIHAVTQEERILGLWRYRLSNRKAGTSKRREGNIREGTDEEAGLSKSYRKEISRRDEAIRFIRSYEDMSEGRRSWKLKTLYNKRSRIESAMHRFKKIFGFFWQNKSEINRRNELNIKVNLMNKMTAIGMPISMAV